MNYDAEYRREDAAGGIGVSRTALDLGRGERAKHVPRSRSDVARQAPPGGMMARGSVSLKKAGSEDRLLAAGPGAGRLLNAFYNILQGIGVWARMG